MNSRKYETKRPRGNPHIAELGRATQFRPGQSGNAGGRPRRTPFADAHREIAELTVRDLLVLPTDSVARAIAKSVASKALKGNISAAAEAANRAEGTPRQRPEESEKGPRELVIRVIEDKPTQRAKLNAEQAADLLPPSDGDREPE
jgi:hypothetical protein